MYNTASRLEKAKVNKYILLLLTAIVLTACSGADDVLENIGDVSVPHQLTGCVARNEDGETCEKAVCVADDESDCKSWIKACEKYGHIAENLSHRQQVGSRNFMLHAFHKRSSEKYKQ